MQTSLSIESGVCFYKDFTKACRSETKPGKNCPHDKTALSEIWFAKPPFSLRKENGVCFYKDFTKACRKLLCETALI